MPDIVEEHNKLRDEQTHCSRAQRKTPAFRPGLSLFPLDTAILGRLGEGRLNGAPVDDGQLVGVSSS